MWKCEKTFLSHNNQWNKSGGFSWRGTPSVWDMIPYQAQPPLSELMNSFSESCSTVRPSVYLSLLLPLRDPFVELTEALETGVGISPFSDGLKPSLMDVGSGPEPSPGGTDSWITMTSSLLCWPRCSLAKSKPFTLGACNWGAEQRRWKWGTKEGIRKRIRKIKYVVNQWFMFHLFSPRLPSLRHSHKV